MRSTQRILKVGVVVNRPVGMECEVSILLDGASYFLLSMGSHWVGSQKGRKAGWCDGVLYPLIGVYFNGPIGMLQGRT